MKRLALLALGTILLSFPACREGTETGNAFSKNDTTVSVRLVSSATGKALGLDHAVPATVRVLGADEGSVTSLAGDPVTEFEVSAGLAVFALEKGRIPSSSDPVRLTVLAGGEGLLETSTFVQLTQKGDHVVYLSTVEVGDLPGGTATAAFGAGTADESGLLENPFRIDTPPDSEAQASASLEVPAGTVLTDAEGLPLTGQLTARITFFNNTTPGSLLSFPGGLGVEIAQDEGGGPELDAVFLSGGFLAAEIKDETGREAKDFSQPVSLSIQIAAGTVNPETGELLQAGDTIPVWSYDTETGQWSFEERGTVSGPDGDGNFEVAFEATHFSYWNLDWKGNVCGSLWSFPNAPFELTLNRSPATQGLPLVFTLKWQEGPGYITSSSLISDNKIDFYRIPQGVPLTFTASHNGVPVGEMNATLDFTCSPLSMNIDFPPPPHVDVPVEILGSCVPAERPFLVPGFRYEFWKDGVGLAAHGVIQGQSGIVEDLPIGTYDVLYWPLGLKITPDVLTLHDVVIDGSQGTIAQTYHMDCETGEPANVKILKFKADPKTIDQGESTTLIWSTQVADGCSIGGIGPVPVNGNQIVSPAVTTTYGLTCEGQGPDAKAYAMVEVEAKVAISFFNASSNSIEESESATLSWSSENATACSINGVGEVAASGTADVSPAVTTTYTLICQGPGGPVSQLQEIEVTPYTGPVQLAFVGSSSIAAGECAAYTLESWDSLGQPAASRDGNHVIALSGAGFTFYYDLACTGGTEITQVIISDGTSSAAFYARSTVAGDVMLAATDTHAAPFAGADLSLAVTSGPAAELAFGSPPFPLAGNGETWPPFTVEIQDSFGNVVDTGPDSTLAVSLVEDGPGSFSGAFSKSAVGGTALFDDVSYGASQPIFVSACVGASCPGASDLPFAGAAFVLVDTPPAGAIDSPVGPVFVSQGQAVNFQATCTDSDGTLPLAHVWTFDGGMEDSLVEDPGALAFYAGGVYEVEYTCTDALGVADPTPPTVTVTVSESVASVSPAQAILGVSTVFTVVGTGLPGTLAPTLTDCAGLTVLGVTSTEATFECTPGGAVGFKSGTIEDQPGGTVLFPFEIEFIETDVDWAQVSSELNHTCAIKTDGTLWCWGENGSGQLGNNSTTDNNVPVQEFSAANDWAFVGTGENHTCAVKIGGTLWCWGQGGFGQLGQGAYAPSLVPVQEFAQTSDWAEVSGGANHTCAIKTDSSLWCWGEGGQGQLGSSGTFDTNFPSQEVTGATDWAQVSAGRNYSCAVKTGGSLWCWGTNGSGQLGNNGTVPAPSPAREASLSSDWAQVSAGLTHTCAVKTGGTLWCWGQNQKGQLGDNSEFTSLVPVQEFSLAADWAKVSAGHFHTCAVKADESLWCWGWNDVGQAGN
ncbi:MAG: hypothetical protein AB1405_14720, partial [Bdellovibrionota bacterium]